MPIFMSGMESEESRPMHVIQPAKACHFVRPFFSRDGTQISTGPSHPETHTGCLSPWPMHC